MFQKDPFIRNMFDFTLAEVKCCVMAAKHNPVFHHCVNLFSDPQGPLGPFQLYVKWSSEKFRDFVCSLFPKAILFFFYYSAKLKARKFVYAVSHNHILHTNRLNKTKSAGARGRMQLRKLQCCLEETQSNRVSDFRDFV